MKPNTRNRYLPLIEPYMTETPGFWAKVAIFDEDSCWPWLGSTTNSGHGNYNGQGIAHCVAYRTAKGQIPEGKEVCHSCNNARCINPRHLLADTHRANMIEAGAMRRGRALRVLTEEIVRAAKLMRASGRKIKEIAEEFGVLPRTLGMALQGKTWKHVQVTA